jgi:hypothetical protein
VVLDVFKRVVVKLRFLKLILYEDGTPSLTRTIALTGFIVFAAVSVYLVIYNIDWSLYPTFATITGGGSMGTQVSNKIINSKFNTPQGSYLRKEDESK